MWIDFFLHEAGPAASWAAQATAGQTLEVGGPKGSVVLSPEGVETCVLIGDEAALPAIGRFLDEMPAASKAVVFADVDAVEEWRDYLPPGWHEVVWMEREAQATTAQSVIAALKTASLPRERGFFWVAMEKHSARAIRRYLQEERGVHERWIKASARAGAGTHEIDDESAL